MSFRYKQNNSFTLMELLVVIAIIGILAALVIPAFSKARARAKFGKWKAYSKNIINEPNLIAFYDFEEGSGTMLTNRAIFPWDKEPSAMDATISAAEWTTGRWLSKGALDFSVDANAIATIPNNTLGSWMYNTTGGTILAWCYPTGTSSNSYIVNGLVHNRTYLQWAGGTSPRIAVYKGDPANQINLMQPTPLNEWYHLGLVWEIDPSDPTSGTMWGYLNGEQDSEGGEPFLTSSSNTVMRIGRAGSSGQNFPGVIDQVAIFDRALSASEIKQYYEAGKP